MLHTNRATGEKPPSAGHWIQMVRGEYLEIPGLQLRRPQIQRLFGLDDALCSVVLTRLTETGFLELKADGHYLRADLRRGPAHLIFRSDRLRLM